MTYFVYLIVSNLKNNKKLSYVGYTNNLKKGLNYTIVVEVLSLQGKKWKLVYYEKYDSKSLAMQKEFKLKKNYKLRKKLKTY